MKSPVCGVLFALVITVSISARGPHEGEVGGARPPLAGVTGGQTLTIRYPDYAAYIHAGVPAVNVAVPRVQSSQRTTRAVDGCGISATNTTQVCFTIAAVEPVQNLPLPHVWVRCNGTARETGTIGQFTFRATRGKLYTCRVDVPQGYGGRPMGAPGAPYQRWITPIQVLEKHVLVILEMQVTK